MDQTFNPCVSCGKPKVIKVGDYCRSCAVDPDITASTREYVILSRATLDIAVQKSGIAREFLLSKMDRAFKNYQNYVIYKIDGKWLDLKIDEHFYIPTVMKNLFRRLED